jgi:hypothetical protein
MREVIAQENRLLFGLTPYDEESFFGFTARLAAWNHLDSRRQLLLSAGFEDLRSQGLEAARGDHGRLAWHLRLGDEQLAQMTGRHDPAFRQYREHVTLVARRVAPAALQEVAYHRSGWLLHRLPFCAESWDILIHQCPACLGKLGWANMLHVELCEHCGFDLRKAETAQIPSKQRNMLSLLACLIDRDPCKRSPAQLSVPPHLAGCSSFQIFELAMVFARAKSLEKIGVKLSMSTPLQSAAHMAAGMDVIVKYPESFDELTTHRNAALPEFFRRARAYAGRESRPFYENLFSDWEPCPNGPSRLRKRREADGQLTLRGAAREMRLENRDLRRLIDRGLIGTPHVRGVVRKYQWLNPEEVHSAARQLATRMSVKEFSHAFKISVRGVTQLVCLDVLGRNQDALVRELHPTLQLDRAEAERLAGRLLALRHVATPEVPVLPLEDVFRGIGGQEKPWGAILRAALAREVTLYCEETPSETLQIGRLQIAQALAWEVLARRRPELIEVPAPSAFDVASASMTRVEVESYLNCFPRDLSWLLAEGHLSKSLRPDEVAALGGAVISSREITWRWRISPARREELASKYGLTRTLGPFWSRMEVEAHFADHFPLGRPA